MVIAQSATVAFASGGIAIASAAVALFFARFWRETGDRFFGLFALAFLLFAANRVVLLFEQASGTEGIEAYLVRLGVFLLILVAIVDKNRDRRS